MKQLSEIQAELQINHPDLRLSNWGPYTKKYAGISNIPDPQTGLRFDLSIFPGYYRRRVLIPNAKWESGYHPWEAAPDLSYYSYRFELEWKDQVTCDISYSAIAPNARLVRCELVNNTPNPQNLVLHYMANLNFPPVRTYSDEPIYPAQVNLPPGAVWIDALDYTNLQLAAPRPQDTLGYDGFFRAEVRANGFVNGSGVGTGFGQDAGDHVEYQIDIPGSMNHPVLLLRYRASFGDAHFQMNGLSAERLTLPQSAEFCLHQIPIPFLSSGVKNLALTALPGSASIELDGLVLAAREVASQVTFEQNSLEFIPDITPGPLPESLILDYPHTGMCYGLSWSGSPWEIRELLNDELDRFLLYYVQEHVQKILHGNSQGHFTNVFIRPIEVLPGESRRFYGIVCSGSREEVEQTLRQSSLDASTCEKLYQQARSRAVRLSNSAAGEQYRFSQERMAATLLTNIVYPVYTRRRYIRHSTPGKWWDCLYTWDSGFIGLGLLELDIERAVDSLNTYTTPPGDPQAAFLHHGSMVPVQHYLFAELWNRTQDRALLEYFYPRLRQYYDFFAGRAGSSTTRQMKSEILKTWDYFYNSGGWDDYPPQVHVHRQGLEGTVTPVISTSHAIRAAKILSMAAHILGESSDTARYEQDIATWVSALNRYSWDSEAGYFGYVCHSPDGTPSQILRHESGQNFNMGLDGASPLFAGICDPGQENLLLERLASPDRLWTRLGVTTVDKTAAYYRVDGYWNGAVWFPQQWFFWKALLDLGQADFAAQIAETALETWKREVDSSYNCFEHFIVQSGRGAGWHHFGGLSTPVLSWYGAYHRPGRLTTGFDTWITSQDFSAGDTKLSANLVNLFSGSRPYKVIASMQPGKEYQPAWNGKAVDHVMRYPGVLEITLGGKDPSGCLEVTPTD
jgi:hypothetical protein